jgi:hypothetical protein
VGSFATVGWFSNVLEEYVTGTGKGGKMCGLRDRGLQFSTYAFEVSAAIVEGVDVW